MSHNEHPFPTMHSPPDHRRKSPLTYAVQEVDEEETSQMTESDLHYFQQNEIGSPTLHHNDISSISSLTYHKDCTETVHHIHNILLYLLTNPNEFENAIQYYKSKSTTSTLSAFHSEYDRATDVGSIFNPEDDDDVPMPFMVFAPDAEVVLPQAHTASQLFGYERDGGIELEATSGILGISQLFLRWLALMPGGDHTNLIQPPGLTVMKIVGGRYRVTAAHRVVWTWNNEFMEDPLSPRKEALHFGDLVTMTIVDVFETDSDGKLLSYCPTFDNRDVRKTDQRVENIRKSSAKFKKSFDVVANSKTVARVNQATTMLGKMSFNAAIRVKDTVQKKLEEERKKKTEVSPKNTQSPSDVKDTHAFGQSMNGCI